ncbi:EC1118_1L10_2256p [Saccharomyces cerevisiae EC1118]|uniref:EC1118_1L10_2256p n=1 Tax=Saccharomyces cerevisiae (strain Lalvin EC1118 / Prise de mousse) TaxID=643680 RepID=C8ZDA9_YEAS8|nr:EC1118_1L10_2256p [Saccharomyces cerevisiae EC1118]
MLTLYFLQCLQAPYILCTSFITLKIHNFFFFQFTEIRKGGRGEKQKKKYRETEVEEELGKHSAYDGHLGWSTNNCGSTSNCTIRRSRNSTMVPRQAAQLSSILPKYM